MKRGVGVGWLRAVGYGISMLDRFGDVLDLVCWIRYMPFVRLNVGQIQISTR
jgi:hypothetical protein